MEQFEENIEVQNCAHHPHDRDIDENGNHVCTICGKIMKTAAEIYEDEELIEDEDEEDEWLFI